MVQNPLCAQYGYTEVSERKIEAKIRAMETYKGEARPDPHPRSGEVLRALAKVRGSESGSQQRFSNCNFLI